jgi:hypothetical protein
MDVESDDENDPSGGGGVVAKTMEVYERFGLV